MTSGADANWVVGEVELQAGSAGHFTGRQAVSMRTDEMERFRDELRALMDSLTGEASLSHLERRFGAKVTLRAGRGEIEVFVAEEAGARLEVANEPTDQSYLAQTLRQLDQAVEAFGVRGSAYG